MSLRQVLIRRAKLRFEFWGGKGEGFNVWAATAPFIPWPKRCLQFLLQGGDFRTKYSDCLKTILSTWVLPFLLYGDGFLSVPYTSAN